VKLIYAPPPQKHTQKHNSCWIHINFKITISS